MVPGSPGEKVSDEKVSDGSVNMASVHQALSARLAEEDINIKGNVDVVGLSSTIPN